MFTVNHCLLSFAAFALIGAESIGLYTSHLILLLLSAGSSYHNIACTVVDRWHGVLWITIYFSCPQNLSLPIILIQVNRGFICPKNFSQNCADSFTDFLTNESDFTYAQIDTSEHNLQCCTFAVQEPESLWTIVKLQFFSSWQINTLISVCSLVFSHFLLGLADTIILSVVLTEKSCFAHIQTILYYFLKEAVNNFSCFLWVFVYITVLFFPRSDHNCCPFPWFFRFLSRSILVSSVILLDVGRKGFGSKRGEMN